MSSTYYVSICMCGVKRGSGRERCGEKHGMFYYIYIFLYFDFIVFFKLVYFYFFYTKCICKRKIVLIDNTSFFKYSQYSIDKE